MKTSFLKSVQDPSFLNDTLMGPNCVMLLQELSEELDLRREMRIMDLGCGKGLTSMYLAEQSGAMIFATDLWIDPTENLRRFETFGLDDRIYPIHAEAHELPYAHEFFDAIVSVDSYHYFGHEEGFLETHITPLLKPGGLLAIIVPGLQREFESGIPEELQPFWQDDMNFHTCRWWRDMWERSGKVEIQSCGELTSHTRAWADWLACDEPHARHDIGMMAAEAGRYFNSVKVIARKTA